jgi:capsular exopolysaccharide synthesis family protein
MATGADERVVTLVDATGTMAEEYRAIRTSLLARWEQRRHVAHVITSATPQEGKTLTTLNLGFCLAELHDRRTVIVEADLRLPQFRKLLPLPQTPGLVGLLQDGASLSEAMVEADPQRLHILPAGSGMRGDAAQWLSSPTMTSLVRELKRLYDHVIIDTPPVVGLADAGILGGMSDEVLLVARMSRTPRPLLEQAVRTLGSYSAPVAGVIATDISKLRQKYYYYRYGYRYHYRYYNRAA